MSYLIDTDIVAAHLTGRQEETTLLASLQGSLAISLITYGEMYEGIYFGRDPKRYEQGFLGFLRGVDVLPLTKVIMKRFARIRGELRRNGTIIGDNDILIGATALQHGLTIVTRNIKHFQRIPDLSLFNEASS
ncbi:MAG: hypothetical protein NVS2B7_34210 [Herpetosiphon sp.]